MPNPLNTRTVPMWRLRADLSLTRWMLTAAAIAGIAATVRLTIAPPAPPVAKAPAGPTIDLAAEGFAEQFVRALLTYDTSHPDARRRALASFAGDGLDPDAGLVPPPSGSQQVQWARVVQQRDPRPGEHVYTVAVQTDRSGLLHLAVDVTRGGDGTLRLGGYPALVGGPPSVPMARDPDEGLREVGDEALKEVVSRALRNYLAGEADQLAADLAVGARIELPSLRLTVGAVESLRWSLGGAAVIAVVDATSQAGARWTLRYHLDVAQVSGRWQITAIETLDP